MSAGKVAERPTELGPSVLTTLGGVVGVLGVYHWPTWLGLGLLLVSLVLDMADGALARHLGATSRFGAQLDWTVDVGIAGALAWRVTSLAPSALGLVCHLMALLLQLVALWHGWRISARFGLTVVACGIAAGVNA